MQVETFNLSDALAQFRAQLERDADGTPVAELHTSAGLVLDDLCAFLGFGPMLRAKVLGPETARMADAFLESRVRVSR